MGEGLLQGVTEIFGFNLQVEGRGESVLDPVRQLEMETAGRSRQERSDQPREERASPGPTALQLTFPACVCPSSQGSWAEASVSGPEMTKTMTV